jgi:hypothetical protein
MPTIIATPKAVDANAYLTLAEATTYLTEGRLHTAEWSAATQTTKEVAIIWATRSLDVAFSWNGSERTLEQALRWPRSGVRNLDNDWFDYDEVPEILKRATANLAFELIKRDRTAEPEILGQGFSQARVASLDVTVDKAQVLGLIPQYIALELQPLGSPFPGAISGSKQVKLNRV